MAVDGGGVRPGNDDAHSNDILLVADASAERACTNYRVVVMLDLDGALLVTTVVLLMLLMYLSSGGFQLARTILEVVIIEYYG